MTVLKKNKIKNVFEKFESEAESLGAEVKTGATRAGREARKGAGRVRQAFKKEFDRKSEKRDQQ